MFVAYTQPEMLQVAERQCTYMYTVSKQLGKNLLQKRDERNDTNDSLERYIGFDILTGLHDRI